MQQSNVARPSKLLEALETVEELLAWSPPDATPPLQMQLQSNLQDSPHRPKLLVCHDYKGGYCEDAWPEQCRRNMSAAYRLSHWRCIDTFVYFSHHMATMPPAGWVTAAHLHGVKVLGTFITEWDAGKAACSRLFASEVAAECCAHQLAAIASWHGFEGWLINIENELDQGTLPHLLTFLRCLTALLHEQHPNKVCIWYDAVTTEGKLEWQDTLNHLNSPFFEACDGLFTNYCWKEETPDHVAAFAGHRRSDVYMGVDVFGRGTPWGGGLASGEAVRAAQMAGVSAALFAPGWVSECGDPNTFEERQETFWSSIASSVQHRRPCPVTSSFLSTFCQGCGTARFEEGRCISSEPWYDVGLMSQQPLHHRFQIENGDGQLSAQLCMDTAFQGGSSLHISGTLCGRSALEMQLFETRLQVPAAEDLLLQYTCSTNHSIAGISLTLNLEPMEVDGSDISTQHVFTPDSGVYGLVPGAHLPTATCHHLMDSTSGDQQLAANWETRKYLIPQHCLAGFCITGIGIMSHSLPGFGSPTCPAKLHGHLGKIVISTPTDGET